jgi:hypothetical protein
MSDLAIVIPAYKKMYFEKAILSVANQTCKEFTLYIGNDASPSDFESLIDLYKDQIHIVYKKFDRNLGERDLVAQWERCIDLTGNESWIWLFSDDDIMDPNCVENFYNTLNQNPQIDLFHFNVIQIDESENIIGNLYSFPELLTIEEFLTGKLKNGYYSTVVEYIFRKSYFFDQARFQNFDLGWCSDDATWIKLGMRMGIKNIDNAKVYWRTSPYNISSNFQDKDILVRKYFSQIDFAVWVYHKTMKYEIKLPASEVKQILEKWFIESIKAKIEFIAFRKLSFLISNYYLMVNKPDKPIIEITFMFLYKFFHSIKGIVKKVLFWNFVKKQLHKSSDRITMITH